MAHELIGNCCQLSHGMRYDYDAGKIIGDLGIGDLAHSLAGINRYNAWTGIYWSVASHACLVAEILGAMADYDYGTILYGLHHDDHESLTGDIVNPYKQSMSNSAQAEHRNHARKAQNAILRALGIWTLVPEAGETTKHAVVKAADIAALEAERRWLFSVRMTWETEKIVIPKMLDAGERILSGDFKRITGGPAAAERFVSHHAALVQRLGGVR